MAHTLTVSQLIRLGELLRGADQHDRVRWAVDGDTDRVTDGVLRGFTDANGNHWHDSDGDVRNAYVRISGTMEHFLPVSDVLELMADGLFFVLD